MELKPCPFCGSPAEISIAKLDYYSLVSYRAAVACTEISCGAAIRMLYFPTAGGDQENRTKTMIAKAWNRRAENG